MPKHILTKGVWHRRNLVTRKWNFHVLLLNSLFTENAFLYMYHWEFSPVETSCRSIHVGPTERNVLGDLCDIFFFYIKACSHFSNSNNVLDATKAFSLMLTDLEDVLGLPESLLLLTAEAAATDAHFGQKGSRFNYTFCCKIILLIQDLWHSVSS